MTNLTPTRLSPSAAHISSLTKEGATTKPETPTLGGKKASFGDFPKQRLSLGKKIWRFLTFGNLRNRARSQQGGVGTGIQVGDSAKPRLSGKKPGLFGVPKGLFFGVSLRPAAHRAEPSTIEPPQEKAKTEEVGKTKLDTAQQVLDRIDARYQRKDYKMKATQLATSDDPKVRAEHDKFNEHKEEIRRIASPHLNKFGKKLLPEKQLRVDELFSTMDEIVGLPNFEEQLGQNKAP